MHQQGVLVISRCWHTLARLLYVFVCTTLLMRLYGVAFSAQTPCYTVNGGQGQLLMLVSTPGLLVLSSAYRTRSVLAHLPPMRVEKKSEHHTVLSRSLSQPQEQNGNRSVPDWQHVS